MVAFNTFTLDTLQQSVARQLNGTIEGLALYRYYPEMGDARR
jgi:hypothetical protein